MRATPCFYGDKAIDRTPCGTGTSARMAQLHAKGKLKEGDELHPRSRSSAPLFKRHASRRRPASPISRLSFPRSAAGRAGRASTPSSSTTAIPSRMASSSNKNMPAMAFPGGSRLHSKRATYCRGSPNSSHDLRFTGLPNADSSRTLRCANDSFRDGPGAARKISDAAMGRAATACWHREKLTLPQSGLETLGLGESKKGMRPSGDIPGEPRTDGIFRPAACKRADAGIDLWADRNRLYDGLRHHRDDQFRPWRHLHGRRLHRADRLPLPDHDLRVGQRRALPFDHDDRRDADDQPLQLDDREGGLPALARIVPAGAADHRDRHVDPRCRTSCRSRRARATSRSRR